MLIRFIILVLIFVTGCTQKFTRPPVCRHIAIAAATNWHEVTDTRMAIGLYRQRPHVQAQAWMNGEWYFIAGDELKKDLPHFKILRYEEPVSFFANLWAGKYRTKGETQ